MGCVTGCPWDGLAPANLRFCEAQLCGWVTEPANTWSNVGFFVVGVMVILTAARERRRAAGLLGPIAIATGLGSVALHATSTFVGQALDQSSMFLESSLFVVLSAARWRPLARGVLHASYAALAGASIAALLALRTVGVALFAAHVTIFALVELRLYFRDRGTDYRPLITAVALFVLSLAVWKLDESRLVCDPQNHVLGLHAIWHLLGAASFWFWFRHFAQFERPRDEQAAPR